MVNAIFGQKIQQSQGFLTDGTRIPTSFVSVGENAVMAVRTKDKHGYIALQLAFNQKKGAKKIKKKGAEGKTAPFLKEIRLEESDVEGLPQAGDVIKPGDVLKPGDIVDVTGISKGKGYAGVVKRHNFKGGPRTHGQSDRERAPGSIGQTTTPGRVYRGKRMSGRMGQDKVTVKNLQVVDITADGVVIIKGLVPGGVNTLIMIKKVGEDKKFVPFYKEPSSAEATVDKPEKQEEKSAEATPEEVSVAEAIEVVQTEETTVVDSNETVKTSEEEIEDTQEAVKEGGDKK